jgi:hypothetical protein
MEKLDVQAVDVKSRSYEAPAVVYEAHLEVRAGTPLGVTPLDVIDPDQ